MKAIVLAILLLSPAIVLSDCTTNNGATANVADGTACTSCIAFTDSVAMPADQKVDCAACSAGYTFETLSGAKKNCVKCASHKYQTMTDGSACMNCAANTQFTGTGATKASDCTACSTNFAAAPGNACADCGKGKFPNAVGVCTTCSTNCNAEGTCTNGEANMCTSCDTGFMKTTAGTATGECVTAITNCKTQASATTCTECDATHMKFTVSSQDSCGLKIADCATQTSAKKCTACTSPKAVATMEDQDSCVAAITNCFSHTSATMCAQCNTGYKKSTTNNVDTCVMGIAGCMTHDPTVATTCTNCASGFFRTGNTAPTADTCTQPIMNCMTYGATALKCTTCMTGYTTTPGTSPAADTCVTKITNCKTFDSDTMCKECATGYTISSDKLKCNQNQTGSSAGIFSALSVALLAFIALLN